MATAFTFNWRVSCKRNSLTDQETYYVDIATGTDKKVATDLAAELKKLGFDEIKVTLVDTLP